MKKLIPLLAVPFLVFGGLSLSSCSGQEKVDLMFGEKDAQDVTTITFLDLKEKVQNKDNFLIAVQYSDGCACWNSEAHPIIKRFVQEKDVIIYHIKYEELRGGGNDFGITIITGQVSVALFENGELKKCLNTRDDAALKDYGLFSSYIESVAQLPRMYYVSKSDVENMYKTNSKSVIYFSRSTCGDCNYIDSHFLKDWSKSHPNYSKEIYVLDCDQKGIRYGEDGKLDSAQWSAFKDAFGLSTLNNPTFGFNSGYVPSFYLVQGSASGVNFLSGAVAFNDTVELVNNQYVVTDTYYTEARLPSLKYIDEKVEHKVLKDLVLTSEDVKVYPEYNNYISWTHESAEKYHNPLLEKFLDYVERQ